MQQNEVGKIAFSGSDITVSKGFAWAKQQALAYAHTGSDPVGLWYEAALPARDAFCIRDVAHQCAGAAALGLSAHTHNMLRRFAQSISEKRDYCMYWEITKNSEPAAVDYTNDADFWYNLPANFDMLWSCWKEYLWTNNPRYLEDPVFLQFYSLTCNEYVQRWDKDADGIPEHYKQNGRRGIASYNEQVFSPYVGGDLLGAMYAGYKAYAAILQKRQDTQAADFQKKAEQIQRTYLTQWYNPKAKRYYGAKINAKRFYTRYYDEGNFLPVHFGILDGQPTRMDVLRDIQKHGAKLTEAKTYFPGMYYAQGDRQAGYRELCELSSSKLKRREYPEVSFNVISGIVNYYMGITASAPLVLKTFSQLQPEAWGQLEHLPVFGAEISLRHDGSQKTTLHNPSGNTFLWEACFAGEYENLFVNGEKTPAQTGIDAAGKPFSFCRVRMQEKLCVEIAVEGERRRNDRQ